MQVLGCLSPAVNREHHAGLIMERQRIAVDSLPSMGCQRNFTAQIGFLKPSKGKAARRNSLTALSLANEADGTRTRNPRIDSPILYPIELRPQNSIFPVSRDPQAKSWIESDPFVVNSNDLQRF